MVRTALAATIARTPDTTVSDAMAQGAAPFSPDPDALAEWLAAHVDGFTGPVALSRLRGGQSNPTFLVTSRSGQLVIRCKPPGPLLPSAHAVDREFRVMQALAGSEVPVPRVHALCEDESVIGTVFYAMEHVPGRIHFDPALPEMDPAARARIYDEMNRVIAALHAVDWQALGLADFGRHGNYFQRQIARWTRQYRASETEHIEAMEQLIEHLPRCVPDSDETTIVHGDFRLDNLVFSDDGRVLAVLDWELSTLGHPLADIAYHCMAWHVPPGVFRGLSGLDLKALGIPSEPAYLARYCERSGRDGVDRDLWCFAMAYNLFRLAAILQGIMGRVRAGTAASADAEAMGRAARPIAELGWEQLRRLGVG